MDSRSRHSQSHRRLVLGLLLNRSDLRSLGQSHVSPLMRSKLFQPQQLSLIRQILTTTKHNIIHLNHPTQICDSTEQPVTNARKCPCSSSDVSLTILDAPSIKRSKGLQPEYREGAEIHHKKPKASDYQDVVQALILRAASEYKSSIATEDAFPDTATRHKWAKRAWKNACVVANEKYELVDRINALVSIVFPFILSRRLTPFFSKLRKRGPCIRGHAVTVIRQLIVTMFGFKRGTDARSKASNCTLVIKLKTNAAFHYKIGLLLLFCKHKFWLRVTTTDLPGPWYAYGLHARKDHQWGTPCCLVWRQECAGCCLQQPVQSYSIQNFGTNHDYCKCMVQCMHELLISFSWW